MFIGEHLDSYARHSADGSLKTAFWPKLLDKWFKTWPIQEPSLQLIEDEGDAQNAKKAECINKTAVSVTRLPADRPGLTIRIATKAHFQSRLGRCCRGPMKVKPSRYHQPETTRGSGVYDPLL